MEIIQELYKGKYEVKFLGPTPDKPSRHMYYVRKKGGEWKRKTGVTTYLGIIDKSGPLVSWATELYRDFLLDCIAERPDWADLEEAIYKGCSLHAERKEEAANIGDQVHKWIEGYIKGESVEMPEAKGAQLAVNAFLDWEKANNVKYISSERVIYSKKYDFMGKMDIEAKVNGKLCLIDIKTSNGIYTPYFAQTAAYVKADQEESGKKYKGRWIIRLAKETEKEYNIRMDKKNKNRIQKGKESIEFPPYQVFETKFLDEDKKNMDIDFKGFIDAMRLHTWNKKRDPFYNKE